MAISALSTSTPIITGEGAVITNVRGKLRNTDLPEDQPLLPLFEAVINSFEAIDDAKIADGRVAITVQRDAGIADGRPCGFTITDNGIGFTQKNLDFFFESDSEHKLARGGKGVGRFMWLKAFERAEIKSHYRDGTGLLTREFTFDQDGRKPRSRPVPSSLSEPSTSVRLVGMLPKYQQHCPRILTTIAHRLLEHCLPLFINPRCPSVHMSDGVDTPINLNQLFQDDFASKVTPHTFTVANLPFTLRGFRVHHSHEQKEHRLIYGGMGREVTDDKLASHIPNLRHRKPSDEEGSFTYLAFVEGDYLDGHIHRDRMAFTFARSRKPDDELLFADPTLDDIRDAALPLVRIDLQPFLDEINAEKRQSIVTFIAGEPQLRPLLRYMDDFIDKIPPGATGRTLERALHEQLYDKQQTLKDESAELLRQAKTEALKPEEYKARLNDFLERSDEIGKASLAEYVVHRKVILDFLAQSLHVDKQTGKYPLEDVIHNLICRMRTTSDDIRYEKQNLWIIDERLTFHEYLASDVQLRSMRPIRNKSAKRPDLILFNRPLAFTEGTGRPLSSLVIIEFKKPDPDAKVTRRKRGGRDGETRKEDPLSQVYDLIRDIKTGHFKDKDGVEIKVQPNMPVYAYVICQLTAEMERICENSSMFRTPDLMGFYGFNPSSTISAYIEVISYDKLLDDARKRNKVLFQKLNLPS